MSEAVRSHRPISIKRRDELAVLIGAADLDAILAAYEFRPEVFFEDDAVSIWLPEFMLYGRGRTYDSAVEDLVEEVRAYVADYLERSVAYLNARTEAISSRSSCEHGSPTFRRFCELDGWTKLETVRRGERITRDTRDGCPTGRSCGRAHPIATNR